MKPSTPPVGTLVTELSHSLSSARLSLAWIIVLAAALELLIVPERAAAQRPVGIDVSTFQGSIDWAKVKASGITFAWARASEGVGYTDPSFTINEANAQAAGVLIGAYHHGRFDLNIGLSGAAADANYFWGVASNYITGGGSYLMPMLDVEGATAGYTTASLSQWVNQWCLTLSNNAAAAGVTIKPVIYASSGFASTWFDSTVTQWTPWIAEWHLTNPKPLPQSDAPASTTPWSSWTVWQYADNTPQPGITANVADGDIFNGNWSSLGTLVIGGNIGPRPVGGRVGFNFMDPADTGSSGGPTGFPACETVGLSDTAGVVPQTGWYNLTAGGGPAYFHAAAGVSIYWESPGGGTHNLRYGITPGDSILMRGYLDSGDSTTNTAIVSSLPFQLYDVICYSIGDNGSATRVGRFTLSATNNGVLAANSTKYIQDNGSSTFTGTYIEATSTNNFPSAVAGNYCRFYAVRGTNFAIRCTPSYGSDGHPRSPFNALQIVQVDPTPTLSNPSYTNGQFQCFLNGATNASYVILASTNLTTPLASWTPVSTNTAPAQITNSPPANTPYRFYRALFQ